MSDIVHALPISPRTLFEEDYESVLLCPLCGFDYVHTIGAVTRVGGDEGKIYRGTEPCGITGARRSALVVLFECEAGHRFALVVQQHKGRNSCTLERWPDSPEEFEAAWRDAAAQAQHRLQERQSTEDAHATPPADARVEPRAPKKVETKKEGRDEAARARREGRH
jgi:hypothetical protein